MSEALFVLDRLPPSAAGRRVGMPGGAHHGRAARHRARREPAVGRAWPARARAAELAARGTRRL